MGNTSSLEQVEPDPWWEPSQTQQDNIQNVLSREIETSATRLCENTNWQQRELAMGQTIQHLAEENMRLAVAKRAAEKKMEETHAELEADTQRLSEELDKLRNEAEKNQQVFEKLHVQIQSGREDRQMITLEMERIRCGFDAEREAKEQAFVELSKLREERDEKKREIESINEKLSYEKKIIEEVTATLNQERVEKECVTNELEKLREELQSLKSSTVDISEQQKLQDVEGPVGTRIRSPEARAEMERFQAEMNTRREVRQRVMQAVSSEIERLKTELNNEREARQQATQQLEQALLHTCSSAKTKPEETLTAELEKLQQKMKADRKKLKQVTQENERLQFELENQKQILTEKTNDLEKLQLQLESERESTQYQIDALKEVGAISKQMLMIRENQVLQLKKNLTQIETSVTNRKHEKITEDLKTEYEAQMENMRSLKGLYEERMKAMLSEKEKLVHDSEEKSQLLDAELKKSAEFEHQIEEMKLSLSEKEEENSNLQIQLDDSQDKSHGLAKELSLINNLFTQMLVGNTATDMDLDKLTKLLQENHDLITEITIRENCSEAAARLPKLLLDLVMQVDSGTASTSSSPTGERGEENEDLPIDDEVLDVQGVENKNSSEECVNGMAVEDIALNLPKVWKVLMELLSHHITPSVVGDHEDTQNSCYKSVDTPSGPRLAISVSKTFLRLKDLILEKKSLQKELTRLKQLNGHLERKLNDQEQKLSVVSSELQKTWNVVDRMQTQHQQLHTHEKILRYELHEKRTLLTELKQELEYCREKWERARQKNSESEVEWRKLRKEFASRKNKPMNSLNNSGESGFADERGEDSCEEDKDTGQLDPGIDLNAGIYKPPSPITDLTQPDILLNPPEVNCDVPLEQTGLLCSEPALSEINVTQVPQSACNHAELLSQSESELLLDLQPDTFPHSDSQNNRSEDTCDPSSIQLKPESSQEGIPDCRLEPTDSNCSTISIITLLKQQLSFFSRNLTEGVDDISGHNLQALESIFSLPPIQIPKSINDNIIKQNYNEQRAFMTYFGQENSPLLSPSVSPALPNDNETANTSCSDHGADHHIVSSEKNGSPSASCISKEMNSTSRCSSDISDREDGFVTPSIKNNSSSILHSDSESPKTSGTVPSNTSRTAEEIAEARAARLKRLEEQCQQLYNKVTRTTHRSTALCNRLEELHEQYRSSDNSPSPGDGSQSECNNPIPPPLPQDLRGRRIPTTSEETSPSTTSTSSPPFLNTVEASQGHTSLNLIEKEASETGNVPSPLSFPHDQYPRQNPTYQDSTEIQVIVHIPTPPPFPENLRGIRLPTCSTESQRISDSLDSTTQRAIETTIQRIPSNVQSQEELSQESDISSSSSNMTKETDK